MKYLTLIFAAIIGAGVGWKVRSTVADKAEALIRANYEIKWHEIHTKAFHAGWDESKSHLLWMIDKDLYERFYGEPHPYKD